MDLAQPHNSTLVTPTKGVDLCESRYLRHSVRKNDNPEVPMLALEIFKNNSPLKQFQEDKSRLRAISYECPDNRLIDRGFRVVDESVSYGKALSPAEFEALRNSRRSEPEVITYGHGEVKLNKRVIQEIKEEGSKSAGCCGTGCCGTGNDANVATLQ